MIEDYFQWMADTFSIFALAYAPFLLPFFPVYCVWRLYERLRGKFEGK